MVPVTTIRPLPSSGSMGGQSVIDSTSAGPLRPISFKLRWIMLPGAAFTELIQLRSRRKAS